MERNQLMHRRLANMKKSLLDQGFLDEQFIQLEELQDDTNPNFVEEVATLYYQDSAQLILNIEQALNKMPFDFTKLDRHMHQFKGSSSSIGAKKVNYESGKFREHCRVQNAEGCRRSFQQLKKEYATLKKKLETYFQLARQAGPLETARRPKVYGIISASEGERESLALEIGIVKSEWTEYGFYQPTPVSYSTAPQAGLRAGTLFYSSFNSNMKAKEDK